MPTTATKPQAAARAPVRLREMPAAPKPRAAKPTRPRAAAKPQPLVLSVVDIIGGDICVTGKDGKKVFNRIHRAFKKKQPVEVSFRGVDSPMSLTFPFMHGAIGSLYEKYDEKEIRPLVKCTDLDDRGFRLVGQAVREGKAYFADPKGYIALQKRIFAELEAEGWID